MIKDSFDKPSNMFQGQVLNLTIALYEIPKPGRKIKIIRHKDIFVESNRIKSFKEMSYATYSVKFTAKERTQLEIPENKAIRIIIEKKDGRREALEEHTVRLCTKDRYFEHCIRYLIKRKYTSEVDDIKFLSGPGKPDIIFGNMDVEPNTHQKLDKNKIAEDLAKFQIYQKKYRNLLKLIIVHNAKNIVKAASLKQLLNANPHLYILNVDEFLSHITAIKEQNIKNTKVCKLIETEDIFKKKKVLNIQKNIDFSSPSWVRKDFTSKKQTLGKIYYSRDIKPQEFIYILQVLDMSKFTLAQENISFLIEHKDIVFQDRRSKSKTQEDYLKKGLWVSPLSFMGLIDEEYTLTSKGIYALRLYRSNNIDAYYRYITRQFLLAKGIRKILKSHTEANEESKKKKFKQKEYNTYIFKNNKELFVGKETYKNYSRYLSSVRSTCKGLKLGTPSSNPYQFKLNHKMLQNLLKNDYEIE